VCLQASYAIEDDGSDEECWILSAGIGCLTLSIGYELL
jgi:hypothetical protein